MHKANEKVSEEEIQKLAEVYSELNEENRKQVLLYTSLILTGQQNSDSEQKAG